MSEEQVEQLCKCDPNCDPSKYEGRTMLYPDEGWHNWIQNINRELTDMEELE